MLGTYDNFPQNIHRTESFKSILPTKQLQRKLVQVLSEINTKKFNFNEVSNPTIPECEVIFEFGLADANSFYFIDQEENKKLLAVLSKTHLQTIDMFCAIRYYKITPQKRTPLKFDYYLLRTIFGTGLIEFQVFHKQGPRYIPPEDLIDFITCKVNETASRKTLKPTENP